MDAKKFDPARAHVLDAPERERYLPTDELVAAFELSGDEHIVDYGAGTGRPSLAAAADLGEVGRVFAVDESDETLEHLRNRAVATPILVPLLVAEDRVPLDGGSVDRVLAVNLLHEVRGETALAEMRRLLSSQGWLLVVDWERGRPRAAGPPESLLYTLDEAAGELSDVGFAVEPLALDLPFHFALRARPH